ncbi:MAG: stage II sporulation protein M [Fimbriimonadales bacterium]|nr:stage II sporulation protein M [Fimbriimonadales bacterium]
MNVRRFVERRRARWERFEQIVRAVRWGGAHALTRQELNELGRLYRQVATDLAYARLQGADPPVIDYLNSLLGQAHGVFYRAPRTRLREGLLRLFYTFPAIVRKQWRAVMLSALLTLAGASVSFGLIMSDPSWGARLIDPAWAPVLEHWKSGKQYTPGQTGLAAVMSSFYFLNNTRVAMLAFGLGFFLGIPTVYLLWSNGFLLGIFAAEMARVGKLGFFLVSIYPHGVPEIGAIFLCGGGGLLLGRALLMPGDLTRIDALREAGRDAIWLLGGSIPLILLAAFTEAFFSFYAFPSWTKFVWGTTALVVLLTYILFVRSPEERQEKRGEGRTASSE